MDDDEFDDVWEEHHKAATEAWNAEYQQRRARCEGARARLIHQYGFPSERMLPTKGTS